MWFCSGQNLTSARIMTRVKQQEYGEALRVQILKSQLHINPTVALNHSSEAISPSKGISRLRVRSHTTTQTRLISGPNALRHGTLIHHHR